jgi:hypothetical protein
MPKIADSSNRDILRLQDEIRSALHPCQTLERAAQCLTDIFFTQFEESVALARCFMTIPYKLQPDPNRLFVQSLIRQNTAEASLNDETTILTLLGTRGRHSAWNDRRLSQGHLGIPLISAHFVDSIPMVSCLLKELEFDLEWLNKQDMSFVERKLSGGWIGVFYVQNASTATDHQGRYIIPAQDFVLQNGIKTVFGLGGIYSDRTMFSLLVFSCDEIDKSIVEAYVPLMTSFRVATAALVENKCCFG